MKYETNHITIVKITVKAPTQRSFLHRRTTSISICSAADSSTLLCLFLLLFWVYIEALSSTPWFSQPINLDQGEETRSGTKKRCSHNLQSGHPAWWSADNYSIFPTVNILEARIESNRQRKSEMLKKLKKLYHATLFFLHIVFVFRYWNAGETKTQPC